MSLARPAAADGSGASAAAGGGAAPDPAEAPFGIQPRA